MASSVDADITRVTIAASAIDHLDRSLGVEVMSHRHAVQSTHCIATSCTWIYIVTCHL